MKRLIFWMTAVLFCATAFVGCELEADAGSKRSAIKLTEDQWTNGKIEAEDDGGTGEQWFEFVATASTQRVYVKFSTMQSIAAYLYDDDDNQVGTAISASGDASEVDYKEWVNLTVGDTYSVKVTGGGYSYGHPETGSYWIGFTDFPAQPETVITELSDGTWAGGKIGIVTNGEFNEQWFEFVATASTQYVYVKFSTMQTIAARLYDSDHYQIGTAIDVSGAASEVAYKEWSGLTIGGTYYLKVTGGSYSYGHPATGNYRIGFSSTEEEPL